MSERNAIIEELVNRGQVQPQTAALVLQRADTEQRSALSILLQERLVSEEQVFRLVAEVSGMEFILPDQIIVDPMAAAKLPADWARRLHALPYTWRGQNLVVAVDEPTNLQMVDDIRRLTRAEPILVLAPSTLLTRAIAASYRADSEIDGLIDDTASNQGTQGGDIAAEVEAPIVRYVNGLIENAISDRASDIHIEPTENDLQVRFRIDGVLQARPPQSRGLQNSIISRIKIMGQMDIAERRVPQDGRISIPIAGRQVDLRVATLPTVWGEKIVLRILDNAGTPPSLSDVGLSKYHRDIYDRHYKRPHGMILVTGPTGSGKSTTLNATVNTLKSPDINVITVEDPVESRMEGVSQMQINIKAGLTFSSALRSILRSDPDVLLVGEIRDKETAQIAIEASLTGHMVLTTLHTNDASSAVTRLVEMGVEPFLVGSAVNLVVAQRLLRKLCDRCSVEFVPTAEQLRGALFPLSPGEEPPTLKRAVGCDFCGQTGYRGRIAIHELLEMTPAIERMTNSGAHSDQIQQVAVMENGMRLMRDDGFEKVRDHLTTIEEVLRVTAE